MKKAFSLVELLVVVAVIAVLCGLLLPVLASAKRSAKRATSISNLHQCQLALLIYAGEGDASSLPPIREARVVLAKSPTCDPSDAWRTACTQNLPDPMVGSYGYVRGTQVFEGHTGDAILKGASNPIVMVSIFYADAPLPRFDGNTPPVSLCLQDGRMGCVFPAGLLAVRFDGSVGRLRAPRAGSSPPLFSWTAAFMADAGDWTKVAP